MNSTLKSLVSILWDGPGREFGAKNCADRLPTAIGHLARDQQAVIHRAGHERLDDFKRRRGEQRQRNHRFLEFTPAREFAQFVLVKVAFVAQQPDKRSGGVEVTWPA